MAGWDDVSAPTASAQNNNASASPWDAVSKPLPSGQPQINFSQPDAGVRGDISKLPPEQQDAAQNAWGDYQVKQLQSKGWTPRTNAASGIVGIGPFVDELNAGVSGAANTLTGGLVGRPYSEELAFQRAQARAAHAANPYTDNALKLATGLATGAAPLSSVPVAATWGGRIAQGAGIGGLIGATEGFGAGEGGLENRVQSAEHGANVGALTGGLLPPVVEAAAGPLGRAADAVAPAAQKVWYDNLRPVAEKIRMVEPYRAPQAAGAGVNQQAVAASRPPSSGADAASDEIITQQMARAGITPQDLQARLKATDEAARFGPNSNAQNVTAPVDLDPSLARLVGSAARAQPEAANVAQRFMFARQTGRDPPVGDVAGMGLPVRPEMSTAPQGSAPMGQFEREMDALRRALQIEDQTLHGHGDNFYDTSKKFLEQAENASGPLYDQVRAASKGIDMRPYLKPVIDKWQAELLNPETPSGVASAISDALKEFTRKNQNGDLEAVASFNGLDKAKQFLDAELQKAFEKHPGGVNRYAAGIMNNVKNDFVSAMDKVPNVGNLYKQARDAFAGPAQLDKALKLGRDVFNDDAPTVASQYQELGTEGERKAFRLGLWSAARDKGARMNLTADKSRLFDNDRMHEVLQAVIPASKNKAAEFANRPQRFAQYVRNERQMMQQTRDEISGNSKTAQRTVDDQAFNSMQSVADAFKEFAQHPSASNLAVRTVEKVLGKLFGMRSDTAVAIARKLMTADRDQINTFMARLAERGGQTRAEYFANAVRQLHQQLSQAGSAASGVMQPTQTTYPGRRNAMGYSRPETR